MRYMDSLALGGLRRCRKLLFLLMIRLTQISILLTKVLLTSCAFSVSCFDGAAITLAITILAKKFKSMIVQFFCSPMYVSKEIEHISNLIRFFGDLRVRNGLTEVSHPCGECFV